MRPPCAGQLAVQRVETVRAACTASQPVAQAGVARLHEPLHIADGNRDERDHGAKRAPFVRGDRRHVLDTKDADSGVANNERETAIPRPAPGLSASTPACASASDAIRSSSSFDRPAMRSPAGARPIARRGVSTQKARSRAKMANTATTLPAERGWLDGLGHGASERHAAVAVLRTRAPAPYFDGAAKRHELLQVVRASCRHGLEGSLAVSAAAAGGGTATAAAGADFRLRYS